jgi:hypothetical protein
MVDDDDDGNDDNNDDDDTNKLGGEVICWKEEILRHFGKCIQTFIFKCQKEYKKTEEMLFR